VIRLEIFATRAKAIESVNAARAREREEVGDAATNRRDRS
jgi:hypothetical protein